MDVKIHESRNDQAVAVIPDRIPAEAERQRPVDPVNLPVPAHKIAVLTYGKLRLALAVNNISFQNKNRSIHQFCLLSF